MKPHILVIGTGSAGKRHARNLHSLGCMISCFDPRQDRINEAADLFSIKSGYTSLEKAWDVADNHYSGVVIASPPSFHVTQATTALERGVPVLLEKPVSPDLAGAQQLDEVVKASGIPLLLGYTWRWWPPLCRVKELLTKKVVGELIHVQFVLSAHLADWHPWENYQDFFMASKELGGGALLDESHWLDLMLWLFGMPARLFARVDTISNLEITTDDNVDLLIEYDDRLRVSIHLDLYGRPHERSISFTGTGGTLRWQENQIMIGRSSEPHWEQETFQYERNDMFVGVAQEFIGMLESGRMPSCGMADGLRVMKLIEAARQSSRNMSMVEVEP